MKNLEEYILEKQKFLVKKHITQQNNDKYELFYDICSFIKTYLSDFTCQNTKGKENDNIYEWYTLVNGISCGKYFYTMTDEIFSKNIEKWENELENIAENNNFELEYINNNTYKMLDSNKNKVLLFAFAGSDYLSLVLNTTYIPKQNIKDINI